MTAMQNVNTKHSSRKVASSNIEINLKFITISFTLNCIFTEVNSTVYRVWNMLSAAITLICMDLRLQNSTFDIMKIYLQCINRIVHKTMYNTIEIQKKIYFMYISQNEWLLDFTFNRNSIIFRSKKHRMFIFLNFYQFYFFF